MRENIRSFRIALLDRSRYGQLMAGVAVHDLFDLPQVFCRDAHVATASASWFEKIHSATDLQGELIGKDEAVVRQESVELSRGSLLCEKLLQLRALCSSSRHSLGLKFLLRRSSSRKGARHLKEILHPAPKTLVVRSQTRNRSTV